MLIIPALALLLSALPAPPPAPPAPLLEISLERVTADKIEAVSPSHVFEPGEHVRLALQSNYEGFLYVMNQGTSGRYVSIFPAQDTGTDNRIHPGQKYLVPNTDYFSLEGPAGFEVLYFILSPTPLVAPPTSSAAAHTARPGPLSSMHPRCNDQIFRARGECMDDSAGPSAVPRDAALPASIVPLAGTASRDITFTRKPGSTSVNAPNGGSAPVIYTFRLAHH